MNVLDLFCGASGGWSLGLSRAGYRTVAACELNDWRRAVFAANHPGCRMYADVRELTADRLRTDLGFLPDIVIGSPPCQEISAANCKGTGITDDHLFWEWARLIFEIRPLWCGAENSPHARTEGIDGILDALATANYAFWPCVVGADNAGANHRRKRLWLIAADAERFQLWQQPWRRSGAHGSGSAVLGEHDTDADGRLTGGARRHADGRLILGAGPNGNNTGDASGERCREGGPQSGEPGPGSDAGACDDVADANGARHAIGPRLGSDDGAELPAALRDIGSAWPHWNGGLAGLSASCASAGFGSLDDGADACLAPSLRNRAIAALGDAVLPQIPEAIGRAIKFENGQSTGE